MMKQCTRCKINKQLDSFPNKNIKKNSLSSWCRECHSETGKIRDEKYKQINQSTPSIISRHTCTRCKIEKNIQDFYRNIRTKTGYSKMCKECEQKRDLIRHRQKVEERKNIVFDLNEERICSKCKVTKKLSDFHSSPTGAKGRRGICSDCHNRGTVFRKYGITYEEKENKYVIQDQKCDICKTYYPINDLCIDHNHTTNRVRGLLCNGCNTSLGFLKENIDILESMKVYINKWQEDEKNGT